MPVTGRCWPFHPKPLPDELLSSWITRIARGNCMRLHTFCDIVWKKKPIWPRDIDKTASDDIIHMLSEKTGTPYKLAQGTQLGIYEGYLFEKYSPFGNTMWILPIGVYHRIRKLYGLQYCPKCLSEDKEPYFRKKWRLGFVTICEKHSCLLNDRCHICNKPINFHRVSIHQQSITLCPFCNMDLRNAPILTLKHQYPIKCLSFLSKVLENGFIKLNRSVQIYSHLYFSVLHQLMRVIAFNKKAIKMRRYIYGQITNWEEKILPEGRVTISIEYLNVSQRLRLTQIAFWLLSSWPHRFVRVCNDFNVLSSSLLRDMNQPPFWFWFIVYKGLYRSTYAVTNQEIQSAVNTIKKQNIVLNETAVSRLLGVTQIFRKRKANLEDFL